MKTRFGKIAGFPENLRLKLNLRLAECEDGAAILAWLNGLPDVQAYLKREWDDEPISKQNLSDWRLGEYEGWAARVDLWQQVALMEDVSEDRQLQLVDNAAATLAARYSEILVQMDRVNDLELERRVKCLVHMTRGISQLQKSVHAAAESRQKREVVRQKETERTSEKTQGQKVKQAQNFHLIGVKAALYQGLYQCDDKCAALMASYIHALEHGLPGAEAYLAEFNRLYKPVKAGQTSPSEEGKLEVVDVQGNPAETVSVKPSQRSPSEQKK